MSLPNPCGSLNGCHTAKFILLFTIKIHTIMTNAFLVFQELTTAVNDVLVMGVFSTFSEAANAIVEYGEISNGERAINNLVRCGSVEDGDYCYSISEVELNKWLD